MERTVVKSDLLIFGLEGTSSVEREGTSSVDGSRLRRTGAVCVSARLRPESTILVLDTPDAARRLVPLDVGKLWRCCGLWPLRTRRDVEAAVRMGIVFITKLLHVFICQW